MSRLSKGLSSCLALPLMALCLCLFGGVFVAIASGDLRDYFESESWQTTRGTVISSQVQESTDSDGSTTYRAYVRYQYTAQDRRYTQDRLQFGDDIYSSGRDGKQKKVDEYPPGKEITVYYDPEDPGSAVVERNLTGGIIGFAVVGLCIMGVGLMFLLAAPVAMLRSMV